MYVQAWFGVLILFYGFVRCGFTRMITNILGMFSRILRMCCRETKEQAEERLKKKGEKESVLVRAVTKFNDR
jgi:hypothetical protein